MIPVLNKAPGYEPKGFGEIKKELDHKLARYLAGHQPKKTSSQTRS